MRSRAETCAHSNFRCVGIILPALKNTGAIQIDCSQLPTNSSWHTTILTRLKLLCTECTFQLCHHHWFVIVVSSYLTERERSIPTYATVKNSWRRNDSHKCHGRGHLKLTKTPPDKQNRTCSRKFFSRDPTGTGAGVNLSHLLSQHSRYEKPNQSLTTPTSLCSQDPG